MTGMYVLLWEVRFEVKVTKYGRILHFTDYTVTTDQRLSISLTSAYYSQDS